KVALNCGHVTTLRSAAPLEVSNNSRWGGRRNRCGEMGQESDELSRSSSLTQPAGAHPNLSCRLLEQVQRDGWRESGCVGWQGRALKALGESLDCLAAIARSVGGTPASAGRSQRCGLSGPR